MRVRTPRLELIASTAEMARAEIEDRGRLARLTGARLPAGWPPPLNDAASLEYALRYLEKDPAHVGWGVWYFALPDPTPAELLLIGKGGFKGRYSPDGTVEVGYSVMEDQQRHGYGSEAAGGMIAWAFSHPEVNQVIAETYPDLRPSIRVMENNGMGFLGIGSEEGVVRYGITRKEFAKRPSPIR